MQVGAGDVLRGQQQEEEEGQVGCRVADELDEGLLDEVSQSTLGGQQVDLRRRRRKWKEIKLWSGIGGEQRYEQGGEKSYKVDKKDNRLVLR